jgi:excisionase family DNA binding protein
MAGNVKRISADEIATELDLDRKTVYQMLKQGMIPNIRAGRLFIVSRVAYERWLETCGIQRGGALQ